MRRSLLALSLVLTASASASIAISRPEKLHGPYATDSVRAGQPIVTVLEASDRRVAVWSERVDGREHLFAAPFESEVDPSRKVDVSGDLAVPGATISGPSIAFDGSTFLVAFTLNNPTPILYTRRLGSDLRPLDPAPVYVAFDAATPPPPAPVIGWTGTQFILVWGDRVTTYRGAAASVLTVRRGLAGAVSGSHAGLFLSERRSLIGGPCFSFPSACANLFSTELRTLVLREDGQWANQGSVELNTRNTDAYSLSVGGAGSSFLAAWKHGRMLGVTAFGAAEAPRTELIASLQGAHAGSSSVAGDGHEWVVAWEDLADGAIHVYAAVIGANGKAIVEPFRLASNAISPQVRRTADRTYAITYVKGSGPVTIETIAITTNPPGRPRPIR